MTDLSRWQQLWEQDETMRPTGERWRLHWTAASTVLKNARAEGWYVGHEQTHESIAADLIHMQAIRWLPKNHVEKLFSERWMAYVNRKPFDLDDALYSACERVIGERSK